MLKKISILFLFVMILSTANAQFIDSAKNKILDVENLANFYQKVAEAKAGVRSLHILHIGDSHIQGGFLTETLREAFQRDFGNAGRGLVFPYRLASTNGDMKVRFSSNVSWQRYRIITDDAPNAGISGATVYTNVPEFTVQLRCNEEKSFNQIEVYGEGLDQVKLAIPKEKGKKLEPQISKKYHTVKSGDVLGKIARKYGVTVSQIKRWNHLKSSLIRIGQKLAIQQKSKTPSFNPSDSQWITTYEQTPTTLKAVLDETVSEIYFVKGKQATNKTVKLYSVHLHNGEQGATYDAVGFNGAKYTDYLRSPRFFEQLQEQERPDLLIISLGTNEAFDAVYKLDDFRADVETFCDKVIAQTGCRDILFTTPPSALRNRKYPQEKLPDYSRILKEVAREKHFAVWDLYEIMGGKNGMKTWYSADLARKDRVHFKKAGYTLQGEALYEALMNAAR